MNIPLKKLTIKQIEKRIKALKWDEKNPTEESDLKLRWDILSLAKSIDNIPIKDSPEILNKKIELKCSLRLIFRKIKTNRYLTGNRRFKIHANKYF